MSRDRQRCRKEGGGGGRRVEEEGGGGRRVEEEGRGRRGEEVGEGCGGVERKATEEGPPGAAESPAQVPAASFPSLLAS